jgi:hypothetical protein
MKANGYRGVAIHAALLAALLAGGCAKGREKEIVVEFPSRARCVVFGEEMEAAGLAGRLAKEQDKSAAFDMMEIRVVVASGMSEEDRAAVERDVRDVIRALGSGNKVTVERKTPFIAKLLRSVWFWVAVVAAAAGGFLAMKRKRAR